MSNPEHIDPVLWTILAILAWAGLYISLRRETVRNRKAERLQREEMARLREQTLRKTSWGE